MDYIGEPIWVRPWWTPAKSDGGEFPKWFTHWNGEDRPTTDRRSSVVVYLQGDDDREGLVGYHTNADGSLEKVTAEQVYAWMFGVDIGKKHKAVKTGQKVWYKTDKDGWKVPLAVGGKKPKGAVTFKKTSGNKKITVNKKTGKVTLKKGLKKGTAYKIKVKVTAKGNKSYKKGAKIVTLTVKVN